MPSSACKNNTQHTLTLCAYAHQNICSTYSSKISSVCYSTFYSFFFNDTATTEIYTLSLHDALPILNSSHTLISYAVFCLRDESVTGVQDRKSTRLHSSHTL